jgi:two-component system chemotaxis response regulator CheY
MSARRILSVGQCAFDHSNISRTFQSSFGTEVVPANTADEALQKLQQGPFALVLVNRIFDRDGDSGLALLRQLKETPELSQVPVMLVSNFEDAQQQAVAAGALQGFGKSALGRPEMLDRVRVVLEE